MTIYNSTHEKKHFERSEHRGEAIKIGLKNSMRGLVLDLYSSGLGSRRGLIRM
jgi:hypothetical protein